MTVTFMTLHSPHTGGPLAIIDGKILTALRTGGVGSYKPSMRVFPEEVYPLFK